MLRLLVLTLVLFLLFVATAAGHDHWINHGNYKDPLSGVSCCGENDCLPIEANRVALEATGYRLLDFDNEIIPFARVIPSEADGDNAARYYRCEWGGNHTTRCFFAPIGGV